MSTLVQTSLVVHVLLGVAGIMAVYTVWTGLARKQTVARSLRTGSLWGFVLLLLSWLSGGYYYLTYYGTAVRGVIKAGKYAWAHTIFMEAKEHVFLFLPFLAAVLFFSVWFLGPKIEGEQSSIRRPLAVLAGLIVVIGVIVTLSGVVISGAVRK